MSFFGKNIRKIRSIKKISQTEFANIFDLSRASVGSYEEGRAEPKIDIINKVANYFSITIDELINKELTVNELYHFDVGDEPVFKITNQLSISIKNIPLLYSNQLNRSTIFNQQSNAPSISIPTHLVSNNLYAISININDFAALPSSITNHSTIIIDTRPNQITNNTYYLIKDNNATYISKLNKLANNKYHIQQVTSSILVLHEKEMFYCYPISQFIGALPSEDSTSKIEHLERQINLLISNTIQ